jgi:hypothetical protein
MPAMSRPHPAATVVVLYGAPGCHLCEDARAVIDALLAARRSGGRTAPPVVERDIHADDGLTRAFLETIPVVEVGSARLELATSPARLRAFLDAALDATPPAGPDETTIDTPRGRAGTDG